MEASVAGIARPLRAVGGDVSPTVGSLTAHSRACVESAPVLGTGAGC